jgi:predicted amidophosphoribosyltransferase
MSGDDRDLTKSQKNHLKQERKTLRTMLTMYCRGRHGTNGPALCDQCAALWDYAERRLGKCPFGETKGPCSKCNVHCYKPEMRDRIREVMRYAGPRMLRKHPVQGLRHLLKGWRSPPESS